MTTISNLKNWIAKEKEAWELKKLQMEIEEMRDGAENSNSLMEPSLVSDSSDDLVSKYLRACLL